MLDIQDIKKLTDYQLNVYKEVFWTREEGKALDIKVDKIQSTLDAVLKDKGMRDTEITILNHRMMRTENFLHKASPKLGITFKR
ncbi:MAG: hypothetical protein WC289_00895 [Patescibacteria group bacterium]|jgi:hypothetical protein